MPVQETVACRRNGHCRGGDAGPMPTPSIPIMKGKVIKVAVPQDFAPFGSAGPDLKPVGYDIDMANLIAKELGVKAEIIPVTSANRIPYLQTKKADLVISSLGKNAEREKVIDFSAAYAPFFSGVYGTKAIAVGQVRRSRRQDGRRDARRDRGAGADQARAAAGPRSSATRTTTPPSRPSSPARST